MLSKLFGKASDTAASVVPEIIGLRLGGAFELDTLRLKLIEPVLITEGMAPTQFIGAVGVIRLDASTTVLRFYTDDEGYLEVLLEGGMEESHISDVKLWYFYDTRAINSESAWEDTLRSEISKPSLEVEGRRFLRSWDSVDGDAPPVAMTEQTYLAQEPGEQTDQFVMLYERQADASTTEFCRVAAEEKFVNGQADRCLVISTGFHLRPADIDIVG